MLAQIPDATRLNLMRIALLFCATAALASCVSKEPPPLVADPNAARDSALPWNEQAKWERDGSAQGLNTSGRRY
jgi:hypothetical protein